MSYAAYDDDSTTSSLTSIRDALALDPILSTNSLTHEERAALRRSDRKAGQILGATLTRDVKAHGMQDFGVGRTPLAVLQPPRVPQADSFVDAFQSINIGALMAAVGAKRPRSRQFSAITLVGAIKDIGASMRLDNLVRKKRCVGAMYPSTVTSSESQAASDAGTFSSRSATPVNDDTDSDAGTSLSSLRLHEGAYVISPNYAHFPSPSLTDDNFAEYDEEEEVFVWNVHDPFAESKNPGPTMLEKYFAKLRLGESLGPLDQPPTESVPFDHLPASIPSPPCSRRSSCSVHRTSGQLGSFLPESDTFGYLRAFDAAEDEERARRKHKRDTLRSRLKKLAILGDEARPAVDGVTSH